MNDTTTNWYALYVKSRHEFVASGELIRKGKEAFLPSIKRFRQWKDRRKLVDFPLFPGYLFVNIQPNSEEFLNVLKSRGVVSFVSLTPGHPTPVPISEVTSLKLMIESGKELNIYPSLKEGSWVRVKRGPLKSAEGILAKKDDHYMFMVNIKLLGRSIGVKMYADDLEVS
jgi:transcription termination/antitermination protein NusG